MIINDKDCGKYLYRVKIGTELTRIQEFTVYANYEQDAVDNVADFIEEKGMSELYADHYQLSDCCDVGQTADEYAKVNGLTCCGNHGIYLRVISIKRKYASKNKDALKSQARRHISVLRDMCIRLTLEETEYLFSLKSEIEMENFCHRIIMKKL